jgi:hypothetical protein
MKFTSDTVSLTKEEYENLRAFCIKHGYTDLPEFSVSINPLDDKVVSGQRIIVSESSPEIIAPEKGETFTPKKFTPKK